MRAAVIALAAGLVTGVAAATPGAARAAGPAPAPPAGAYKMDLAHASVNFRLSHLGLSNYTARFTRMEATLRFDPAHPTSQSVEAVIDANSLQTNYPDPKALNFDSQVEKEFLETAKHPKIVFRSTHIDMTGPRTARITGDLTLHGVTRPIVLQATYNGGYPPGGMDPMGARIGFSAHGAFKRSDFGIRYGLPAPGSNMGVGDQVEVIIEAEFTRPAAPKR